MGKVNITLKSFFVTRSPRKNRKPTVYKRSIRKLLEDKKHPGKILRVYIHIDQDYKTFGVFTINTGGSISFFPDFYKLNNFDHFTVGKDFGGHLTTIGSTGKHKKAYFFEAELLPTRDYHLVTFMMKDGDMLMDSLPEVQYPDIEFEDGSVEDFLALLKDAIHTDPYMLDFPEGDGFYCVQVLIVAKEKDINDISILTSIIESSLSLPKPLEKIIQARKLIIETPKDFDFSICLIAFKVNQKIKTSFAFFMSQDPKHKYLNKNLK